MSKKAWSAIAITLLLAFFSVVSSQLAHADSYSRNLTIGDTGSDVSSLQQFLISGGFLHVVAPTGYFGSLTEAAVAAWQGRVSLPTTGYFGSLSRAAIANQSSGTETGGGTAVTVTFTRNLTIGDTGSDVSALQGFLISNHFLHVALPTGYFGQLTEIAVAAWQKSVDLPSTGFFGPLSRGNLNAALQNQVGGTSGATGTTGVNSAGSITTGGGSNNGGGGIIPPPPPPPNINGGGGSTSYSLTLSTSGSGVVISNPSGISCGSVCSATFTSGTPVSLTETPLQGGTFNGWSGACSGTGVCTVTMNSDESVGASFGSVSNPTSTPPTVSITNPTNGATVSSVVSVSVNATDESGITQVQFYLDGVLQTTANSLPYTWSWNTASSANGPHTLYAQAYDTVGNVGTSPNVSVTVSNQTAPTTYTLNVADSGSGTVTSQPSGISCGNICGASFNSGTSVTLNESPANGYTFSGWSGACAGNGTCTVAMNSNQSVTATFTQQAPTGYSLTVVNAGTGSGTEVSSPSGISCPGTCSTSFASGTTINLTATPLGSSTWNIVGGWTGCDQNPSTYVCKVVLNSNRSVTATFGSPSSSASIAFVQVASGGASAAFTKAQTAGDLNVVFVGWNDTSASITSVTDSAGNTYQLAAPLARGTGISQAIYYAQNIKSSAAGNTVTASFSPAASGPDVRVLEYSGIGTNPFDTSASGSGTNTGGTVSTANLSTSGSSELLVGGGMTSWAFTGAGTNYTSRIITSSGDIAEDRTISSQGSYNAGAQIASQSQNWLLQVAAFKAGNSTGTPPPTNYTLNVTDSGSGTVTSNPSGISCGSTCGASFTSGQNVVLSEAPGSGYTFSAWSGACSGNGTCTVAMNSNQAVTATFVPAQPSTYTLSVTTSGAGTGTVVSTPSGVNCGSTCNANFNSGTNVSLAETPASGYTFGSWGGACSGTGSCSVTMNSDQSVTATFSSAPPPPPPPPPP